MPFLSLVILRESQSVNVGTFHAYGGWSPAYEFGSRALSGYAERLHGRIAVSAAARHFIDRYFPGDYKVIPNGVDLDRFRRAVPLSRWQDGTPNVLFVGRFEPRKGVLDILKAHRILRRDGRESRLLLVGGGPQEREARRYVATRRLRRRRVPGPRLRLERDQLFKTADVYVSPATGRESFGIVLLEAMAAGAPIVASDIHGYKGVVRRGREALLVPPRDPKELADAIERLLARPRPRGRDVGERPAPRRGVQLAAGHREGRRLLRVRHPAARRGRGRCRRTSRRRGAAVAPGRAARGRHRGLGPRRAGRRPLGRPGLAGRAAGRVARAAAGRVLGVRDPPDPRGVRHRRRRRRRANTSRIPNRMSANAVAPRSIVFTPNWNA